MSTWMHIVGGGLSGLSLANSLSHYKKLPGHVIISEPDPLQLKTKTFSFWLKANEQDLFQPTTQNTLWSISYGQRFVEHKDKEIIYGTRTGASVLNEALNHIREHPQIELKCETLLKKPTAMYCFDSRPPDIESFKIVQSFAGLEVKLEYPHQLESVQLMHDLTVIENGIQFRYVIPFSPTQLLIEYTQFAKHPGDLKTLMALNHLWAKKMFTKYKVIRIEKAHIPMGITQNASHWGIPIGARAGMTRDATGYGYRNIVSWSRRQSAHLVDGNPPQSYHQRQMMRLMDKLFLGLIEDRPDTVPNILMTLAERLTAHQFAQFMTDNRLYDALRVISSAPKRPFIGALLGKYSWI